MKSILPSYLEITVLSGLLIGTGTVSALDVDSAMQTDGLGLPLIARRQLNARMRDSAIAVIAAFGSVEQEIVKLCEDLLGTSGRTHAGRLLHIGDAILVDDLSSARARAAQLLEEERLSEYRDQVAAHTFDRTNTARDRDGAPVEGSLRFSRLAKHGLVFRCELRWHSGSGLRHVIALARMCLALKQIGSDESNGAGRVELALEGDRAVTELLASLRLDGVLDSPKESMVAGVPSLVDSDAEDAAISSRLVTLEMRQELALAPSPGWATRAGEIPGSALRGAVFQACEGNPELEALLVTSEIVSFGPSFLITAAGRPLVAPPLTAMTQEIVLGVHELHDVFAYDGRNDAPDLDWLRRPITPTGNDSANVELLVANRLNRAESLYFSTAYSPPGGVYRTELRLTGTARQRDAALRALQHLVSEGAQFSVGSGSENFGGGLVPSHISGLFGVRESGELPTLPPWDAWEGGIAEFNVILASPALVRDARTGMFRPHALGSAVADQWRTALGEAWRVQVVHTATEGVVIGGFNSRFRSHRPGHTAAAAGSVVRLRIVAPDALSADEATGELEDLSPDTRIGERTVDGFGVWYTRHSIEHDLEMTTIRREDRPDASEAASATPLADRLRSALAADRPPAWAIDEQSSPESPTLLRIAVDLVLETDTSPGHRTRVDAISRQDDASEPENLIEIERDHTGTPMLRGSSLRGALRHYLKRRIDATSGAEAAPVLALFGEAASGKRLAIRSALAFEEGYPAVEAPPAYGAAVADAVQQRSHIAIDQAKGTVQDGMLAKREVLPAGTVFPVRISVALPKDDPSRTGELLSALAAALSGFAESETTGIRLGARTGRGFGEVRARDWRITALALDTPTGFLNWGSRTRQLENHVTARHDSDPSVALRKAVPGLRFTPAESVVDAVVLRLTFSVGEPIPYASGTNQLRPGTVRIGDGVASRRVHADRDAQEVSIVLRRPVRKPSDDPRAGLVRGALIETRSTPIDSGTSWHSALKRTAAYILAGWRGGSEVDSRAFARNYLTPLFGSYTGDTASRPSRVQVSERPIEGSAEIDMTRNRIDPLTQATSALFTEEVLVGGATTLAMTVNRPTAADLAVLWMVLRDYRDGFGATTGAGAGIGHGRRALTGLEVVVCRDDRFSRDFAALLEDDPADEEALVARMRAHIEHDLIPREAVDHD